MRGDSKKSLLQEIGQTGIVSSSRFIQDLRKEDLKMENRVCTVENMYLDDAVGNATDVTNIQVVSALAGGSFISSGSAASDVVAEFLNYNIRNLGYGTWMEAMATAATDIKYGFSMMNIVVKKAESGPYKGSYVLHKLAPRHPKSVYGWVFNKNNTELMGMVQKPMYVKDRDPSLKPYMPNIPYDSLIGGNRLSSKYPFISSDQMLHFRYNPTYDNPQGSSPYMQCYDAWVEKKLIEHYEVVGVSKDFGGVIIIRVPSELIDRANDPEKFPDEAREYEDIQIDAANLQQGKSTHIILTSDTDEKSGKPLYDLELRGLEGGGKQYKTEDLINQRRKAIYNNFGAGFLLLGQNGHGSNALAGTQMSTHDYYINQSVKWKEDVINNQLVPKILAANNIELSWKDVPKFIAEDPSKPDFDTISKVLMRTGSVELLTDKAVEGMYVAAGWSTDGLEEHLKKREDMKIESRAGESQGSSGTGNTQAGGAASTTNAENKSLVFDYETDKEIFLTDTATGNPLIIEKE